MRLCDKLWRGGGLQRGAALALIVLASGRLLAETHGTVLIGSITGLPGSAVSLPLTVSLDPGVSIDTLGITVVVSPVAGAPALTTGKLSFTPAPGISSPSLSSADAADIVLAWLGNLASTGSSPAISGIARLGVISATIPTGAINGHSYLLQIAKVEADISGSGGAPARVPLAAIPAAIGPISTSLPLPPVIQSGGIVNGASFSAKVGLSPGSIASLFGLNLAPAALSGSAAPPATVLGDTQLLFNGIPAPLFYVSPDQINFQMPVEVSGTGVSARVVCKGMSSLAVSAPVAPVTPGIFTQAAGGVGPGAVLNQDYSLNSAQNPAAAGSGIMIYATGLGPTNPPVATGQSGGTSPPSVTVETPAVLINGAPAQVLYSGLAPGYPGEYQVNAVIPADTPAGAAVSLQIRIGAQSSNTVTIAVR